MANIDQEREGIAWPTCYSLSVTVDSRDPTGGRVEACSACVLHYPELLAGVALSTVAEPSHVSH